MFQKANKIEIEQANWYQNGIEVKDVTGDCQILIVRIFDDKDDLRGLWLEKRSNDKWVCLQDDVDPELVDLVIGDKKVVEYLESIAHSGK